MVNAIPIIFNLKNGLFYTLEDFQAKSKGKLDQKTQQAVILVLSKEEYYANILQSVKEEANIEEPSTITDINSSFEPNTEQANATKDAKLVTLETEVNLKAKVPNRDYAEFVINIIKKTVKQEDSLVRQIFYTVLSAYTNDPINLGIMAPTSEGKTYPVVESIRPFPKDDIWRIGSMSTKLLVRQKGTLVNENYEPLKPKIKELKKQIRNTDNVDKQDELKEHIIELYENARSLIELSGKTLVFLEPPQHDLWNLLKPILSHDSEEIEFPFVDKTERGFQPRRVIVRGWPACIFCSARDESHWDVWPEVQSRFLITSPNMIPQKYHDSNLLIAQKKSLPGLLIQKIVVSDEDIKLAKDCISYLKLEIQKLSSFNKNRIHNPVWIPYYWILADVLPAEKGNRYQDNKKILFVSEYNTTSKGPSST